MSWRFGVGMGALTREGGVSAKRQEMADAGMICTR